MVLRVPSAEAIGRAQLQDKRVVFNKRSKDGSGKANLLDSYGSIAWGVLYKLDFDDIETMNRIEGGYTCSEVTVQLDNGTTVMAKTYISMEVTDEPVAYDWYKDVVITGAREHNLPVDYVRYLDHLPSKDDTSNSKAC